MLLRHILKYAEDRNGLARSITNALGLCDRIPDRTIGAPNAQLELVSLAKSGGAIDEASQRRAVVFMIEFLDLFVLWDARARRQSMDPKDFVRPCDALGYKVEAPVTDAGHRFRAFQETKPLVENAARRRKLELVDDHLCQRTKKVQIDVAGALPGFGVDDAQRAQIVTALRRQNGASVEADMRGAHHQRIIRKPGILRRVFHDQNRVRP
nr:hypothetical protein [Sphingomonas glacialis]